MKNQNNSCIHCSKNSCPFALTDESEQIQNYGCLPTPQDILVMRVQYGKTWACHSNTKKPCLGALERLIKLKLPYKVVDKDFIDESSDWSDYVKADKKTLDLIKQRGIERYIDEVF